MRKLLFSSFLVIAIFVSIILVNIAQSQTNEIEEVIPLPEDGIGNGAACTKCCDIKRFDVFLKIEGIDGESTDNRHMDWMDVLSYDHSVIAEPPRRAEQRYFYGKLLDKASPKLALAVHSGEHFKEAILEVCRVDGDRECYMQYRMSEVVIDSYNVNGDTKGCESRPMEQISLSYNKIVWAYTPLSPGGPGTPVTTGWNLKQNKKV